MCLHYLFVTTYSKRVVRELRCLLVEIGNKTELVIVKGTQKLDFVVVTHNQ